jgi:hypothetical protein
MKLAKSKESEFEEEYNKNVIKFKELKEAYSRKLEALKSEIVTLAERKENELDRLKC